MADLPQEFWERKVERLRSEMQERLASRDARIAELEDEFADAQQQLAGGAATKDRTTVKERQVSEPFDWEALANHLVDRSASEEHQAAFRSLAGGRDPHDVRMMVIRALRFSDVHDIPLPRDLQKATTSTQCRE